ncbi:cell wall-binding repeat-containing protein [Herbiconiux moechotypicola]|uniref:Cell wall-binding repeat-containing protein n=1 Tax=Herbiconiux moechotypicola TaxID=637393 RepID=A0ABN3DPZ3_9MICO|nr:cell wall-binding repeat-containing protein [Herbiconiux moechotypicola]MCS5731736.1 cell wall-binding repeat-containing protein [Herbiconiux moechotypicola]
MTRNRSLRWRTALIAWLAVTAVGWSAGGEAAAEVRLPRPGRIAGADRYAQAVEASRSVFSGSSLVYLASGESFPDALSAASVAGVRESPLLLVPHDRAPDGVVAEIRRLRAEVAVVVGGRSSIDDEVLIALSRQLPGVIVSRVQGADRYATSRTLLVDPLAGAPDAGSLTLATGADFPDALAAASPAARRGAPVLLLSSEASDPAGADAMFLRGFAPDATVIVGGPRSITPEAEATLGMIAPASRLSGADRYATAVAVSRHAYASARTVYLTSGTGFADALSGGPVAAHAAAPLLVVRPDCVPGTVRAELERLAPDRIVLLGGTASLGAAVERLETCP